MAATGVRRMSAADAKRCDLYSGPIVLTPFENLKASSGSHETATSLEEAKLSLDETTSNKDFSEIEHPDENTTDKFAIAFDIDGVLMKGGKPLPTSVDAMRYINGHNPHKMKM